MVLNTNLLLTVIFPSILFYEEGAGWWQWEVVFIGRTTLRITVTVRITWLKFFFFLFALHCIFSMSLCIALLIQQKTFLTRKLK